VPLPVILFEFASTEIVPVPESNPVLVPLYPQYSKLGSAAVSSYNLIFAIDRLFDPVLCNTIKLNPSAASFELATVAVTDAVLSPS